MNTAHQWPNSIILFLLLIRSSSGNTYASRSSFTFLVTICGKDCILIKNYSGQRQSKTNHDDSPLIAPYLSHLNDCIKLPLRSRHLCNGGWNWYTITVTCWIANLSCVPSADIQMKVNGAKRVRLTSQSALLVRHVISSPLFRQTGFLWRGVMMFAILVFTPHCCRDLKALTQDTRNLPDIWLRILYELWSLAMVHKKKKDLVMSTFHFFSLSVVCWINTSLSFYSLILTLKHVLNLCSLALSLVWRPKVISRGLLALSLG